MRIEDSEKKFGKRWTEWTKEETSEHVRALDLLDMGIPANLRFATEHWEDVPGYVKSTCLNLGMVNRMTKGKR